MAKQKSLRRTEYVPEADKQLFDWCGEKLPQGRFSVCDVDKIFVKSGNIMFCEVKSKMANVGTSQYVILKIIHAAMKRLDGERLPIKLQDGKVINLDIKYHGYKLLQFENTFFDDGKAFINNKEVTEKESHRFIQLQITLFSIFAFNE